MLLSKLSCLFQNARHPWSGFWRGNCPAAPSSAAPGTLDSAHIILTGATAGSERAPQGFMLSMQSTTIYCCVEGLRGVPLHGSWVLVVLKRALYIALSGSTTGQLKGRHFARGRPPPPPLDPRLPSLRRSRFMTLLTGMARLMGAAAAS